MVGGWSNISCPLHSVRDVKIELPKKMLLACLTVSFVNDLLLLEAFIRFLRNSHFNGLIDSSWNNKYEALYGGAASAQLPSEWYKWRETLYSKIFGNGFETTWVLLAFLFSHIHKTSNCVAKGPVQEGIGGSLSLKQHFRRMFSYKIVALKFRTLCTINLQMLNLAFENSDVHLVCWLQIWRWQ